MTNTTLFFAGGKREGKKGEERKKTKGEPINLMFCVSSAELSSPPHSQKKGKGKRGGGRRGGRKKRPHLVNSVVGLR